MINILETKASTGGQNIVIETVRDYNIKKLIFYWQVLGGVFFFSIMFYVFGNGMKSNGGLESFSGLTEWIYGKSDFLAELVRREHGLFDTGTTYLLVILFHIPHVVVTCLTTFCLIMSMYLPFKNNYSVQELLDIQTSLKAELDTEDIKKYSDGKEFDSIEVKLKKAETDHTQRTKEIDVLKQKLDKESLYTSAEYEKLETEFSDLKEKVMELRNGVISLKNTRRFISEILDKKKGLEDAISVLESVISYERAEQGITTMV